MKRNGLSKYREQFSKAIDHAIKECSRKTGITDLETVYQHVKKSASMLFKRLSVLLADEQIRILIQKRLKHCTVSVADAHGDMIRNLVQIEFEFFAMDQFRGVPKRISYPAGNGKIEYVEYNRSTEAQRLASISHLDIGITADIARREAEASANSWLHPLVVKHGDLPAEKLAELWLLDQRGGSGTADAL